jgi:hypothetical protein
MNFRKQELTRSMKSSELTSISPLLRPSKIRPNQKGVKSAFDLFATETAGKKRK